jgi:hypothetical protein
MLGARRDVGLIYISVSNMECIRLPYTLVLIIYMLLKGDLDGILIAGGQGNMVVIFGTKT